MKNFLVRITLFKVSTYLSSIFYRSFGFYNCNILELCQVQLHIEIKRDWNEKRSLETMLGFVCINIQPKWKPSTTGANDVRLHNLYSSLLQALLEKTKCPDCYVQTWISTTVPRILTSTAYASFRALPETACDAQWQLGPLHSSPDPKVRTVAFFLLHVPK